MKRPKLEEFEPMNITREEELKLQQEFIEKNGVTILAPDARLKDPPDWSAWKRRAKPAKKKKVSKAKGDSK